MLRHLNAFKCGANSKLQLRMLAVLIMIMSLNEQFDVYDIEMVETLQVETLQENLRVKCATIGSLLFFRWIRHGVSRL